MLPPAGQNITAQLHASIALNMDYSNLCSTIYYDISRHEQPKHQLPIPLSFRVNTSSFRIRNYKLKSVFKNTLQAWGHGSHGRAPAQEGQGP
jgi:hypothetical protein